jgi:hypothetical protein
METKKLRAIRRDMNSLLTLFSLGCFQRTEMEECASTCRVNEDPESENRENEGPVLELMLKAVTSLNIS